MEDGARVGRREFVASAVATLTGCSRVRSVVDGQESTQVTLSIKTTPADDDSYAIRIAHHLADNLEKVGIAAEITPMTTEELLRNVLIDHEFDLYVARHPGNRDPDFLRAFVHSKFGDDPGWQNPFGYADLDVDTLLERQRIEDGRERWSTVGDLQWSMAQTQPFTTVAHPDSIHAVRTDRVLDWPSVGIQSPDDLLSLPVRRGASLDELRLAITDPRVTTNRNPLSVTFRDRGLVTGLLYEPLARWADGQMAQRLVDEWHWQMDGDTVSADVDLRDAVWHDGEPVTAADVEFTYRFIADTSLGEGDVPVPAPRFRGRVSLVDDVSVVDDRTVALRFNASRDVARRAFDVPVLPTHEWEPRAREAEIAGFDLYGGTTEALVWNNPEPVGSGPLSFERAAEDEVLVLGRFEDHFNAETGEVPYEQLAFQVVPSEEAAVELAGSGEVDATGPLSASTVTRIARAADLTPVAGASSAFYHVGYNTRSAPLNNPRFRLGVAALVDRETIQSEVFDGYATPSVSPLVDDWLAPGLVWEGVDPVAPFPERNGELDVARARETFEQAGYRYRDDGTLVR
jgi:peptide/nickel transport system substrate-binding protein